MTLENSDRKARQSMSKGVETMRISRGYWTSCGEPEVSNQLFRSCLYIGYGASATRVALVGLDVCADNIIETAESLGMTDHNFKVVISDA